MAKRTKMTATHEAFMAIDAEVERLHSARVAACKAHGYDDVLTDALDEALSSLRVLRHALAARFDRMLTDLAA